MLKTFYLWILSFIFIGNHKDKPMKFISQLDLTWFFVLFFGLLIFIRNFFINNSTKKNDKIEETTIRQLCNKGQMCMISRKLSQSNINENKCRFSTLKKGFNLSVKVNNNLKKDYFPNLKIIVNKKSNCFQGMLIL